MQKIISALVILASVSVGWIDALASGQSRAVNVPSVSDVLPDPLPLDMSDAPSLRAPKPLTIEMGAPTIEIKTWSRVWICGESRPLENDATQTVRECEEI